MARRPRANPASLTLLAGLMVLIAACSQAGPGTSPPAASTSSSVSSPVKPSPSGSPSVAPDAHWLTLLNEYRTANGLKPVVNDPALSAADKKHAQYLVKNHVGFTAGIGMHDEDHNNQWYTAQGYWAGHSGNVMLATRKISQSETIQDWIGAPFHGLAMLAPDLRTSGFGSFCEGGLCAAVLSTGHMSDLRHAAKTVDRPIFDYDSDAPEKRNQAILETPIRWPAPGMSIVDGGFDGREWPSPLSACPGYQAPTGVVIFASFGRDFVAEARPESLTCNGAAVEHCLVNAQTYTSPDHTQLENASKGLRYYAAVLLIPRRPIDPGSTCEVSLTVEGIETQWSFSVRPDSGEVENQ